MQRKQLRGSAEKTQYVSLSSNKLNKYSLRNNQGHFNRGGDKLSNKYENQKINLLLQKIPILINKQLISVDFLKVSVVHCMNSCRIFCILLH